MKSLFLSTTDKVQCKPKKNFTVIIYVLLLLLSFRNVGYGQWLPQTSQILNPNQHILSISAVDENVVWAVVDTNVYKIPAPNFTPYFMRTVDGGLTWETSVVPGIQNEYIMDISAFDADTAWICTDNAVGIGGVYKTTDGGSSWQKQTSSATAFIHFFDAQAGIIQVGYFLLNKDIYTTENGGKTWIKILDSNFPQPLLNEAITYYATSNYLAQVNDTIWLGTTKGRIYKSTNRGHNWTVWPALVGENAAINSIAFQDSKNGLAVSCLDATTGEIVSSKMATTSDGGETWTTIPVPEMPSAANITYVPGTDSTYVLTSSIDAPAVHGSAYTKDFGKTWTVIDSFPYNAVAFVSPTAGWAGALTTETHGGMFKWTGDLLVGIGDQKNNTFPAQYKLSQNYPNPFNPKTTIKFQIPSSQFVSLQVFNILGQKIATLVNGKHQAGEYSVEWDSSSFTSGLYLYVLKTNKGYMETRKLLLVK